MGLYARRYVLVGAMLLAIAMPVFAQDSDGPRFPFLFVLDGDVEPEMMSAYDEAVAQIVSAHKKHDNGNTWAAFTPLTGGGKPHFSYYLPMGSVGEMDAWTPNPQVIAEAHGPEVASDVLGTMGKAWSPSTRLLAYNPELSNRDTSVTPGPPSFAWHLVVRVEPGAVGEYIGMVRKIVGAHQKHDDGLNWVNYGNMIGGEGTEFHYFIRMDKLGDMDGWPLNAEIVSEVLGAEEWGKMQQRLGEITNSGSTILVLSPTHSNLPPGDDG